MPTKKKLVFGQISGRKIPIKQASKAANIVASALRKNASRSKPHISVNQLHNKFKRLDLKQRGSLQMDRQVCKFVPAVNSASPYYFNPSMPTTIRPLAILHQAISEAGYVWTNQYVAPNPPSTFSGLAAVPAGSWVSQKYPIIQPIANGGYGTDPALFGRFDQLQYWSQANGVSNDYTHFSTKYEILINAKNVRGYLDVHIVHPKKSYLRSSQQDVSLPTGLAGFCNMSLGSKNMYSLNNEYYTCKRLKRCYFNTTKAPGGAASTENFLQTNPDREMSFTIKNKKSRRHIKSPELAEGATLDSTDIPFHKQDWIIISTTLENKDVSADNNMELTIYRTPIWRDRQGAST